MINKSFFSFNFLLFFWGGGGFSFLARSAKLARYGPGLTPTTVVIEAAKHVIDGKVTSIRATAKNKVKKAVDKGMPLPIPGYIKLRQVFTFEQEIFLHI